MRFVKGKAQAFAPSDIHGKTLTASVLVNKLPQHYLLEVKHERFHASTRWQNIVKLRYFLDENPFTL